MCLAGKCTTPSAHQPSAVSRPIVVLCLDTVLLSSRCAARDLLLKLLRVPQPRSAEGCGFRFHPTRRAVLTARTRSVDKIPAPFLNQHVIARYTRVQQI